MAKLRERAARILAKAFDCEVDPNNIFCVTGFWKYQDVHRWDVRFTQKDGVSAVLGCWESLTEFVRNAKNGLICSDYYGKRIPLDKVHGCLEIAAMEMATFGEVKNPVIRKVHVEVGQPFQCPCGKEQSTSHAYVAAHWNEKLNGSCPDCNQEFSLKSGTVKLVGNGKWKEERTARRGE